MTTDVRTSDNGRTWYRFRVGDRFALCPLTEELVDHLTANGHAVERAAPPGPAQLNKIGHLIAQLAQDAAAASQGGTESNVAPSAQSLHEQRGKPDVAVPSVSPCGAAGVVPQSPFSLCEPGRASTPARVREAHP